MTTTSPPWRTSIAPARDVLYLGRGPDYPMALEGALKLKEISYIHAEGYAAGEMKHGPIALIDEDVPVIVLAPSGPLFEKTVSNMQEVRARGGKIVLISDAEGIAEAGEGCMATIEMPEVHPLIAPLVYAVPVQLLAYHVAVLKGTDVDQPRNLAKSVTVDNLQTKPHLARSAATFTARLHESDGWLSLRGGAVRGGIAGDRRTGARLQLLGLPMTGFLARRWCRMSAFELLTGRDALTSYRFGSGAAEHLFCRHCGVKSFYQPRSHPEAWSVNANCLDAAGGARDRALRRPELGSRPRLISTRRTSAVTARPCTARCA